MAEHNEVPSFSISEGQEFAKLLIKRGFLIEFCKSVDPILILPTVQLRTAHEQKIRRQRDLKSDQEVNMDLWDFIIKETEWVDKLYRALQLQEYFFLQDMLKEALEEWKRRGHN